MSEGAIQTVVVKNLADLSYSGLIFPIFVLYDRPRDFPDKIVVRVWDRDRPTKVAALFNTLEEARAAIPEGLVRFPRAREDDGVIIESYL